MFELNLSNALALIDQPVWVVTEVRSRNKNGRIYAKSRAKSAVYPGNIQTVSVWRGYARAGDSVGAPKCTVESASIPAMTLLTMSSYPLSC